MAITVKTRRMAISHRDINATFSHHLIGYKVNFLSWLDREWLPAELTVMGRHMMLKE